MLAFYRQSLTMELGDRDTTILRQNVFQSMMFGQATSVEQGLREHAVLKEGE